MKRLSALILTSLVFGLSSSPVLGGIDGYHAWAVPKWGVTLAGSDTARSTTWGENADPDQDGLCNLVEHATDTDPKVRNVVTDCYVYSVPHEGSLEYRHPEIALYMRQDDPDLRVFAQTSADMDLWLPSAPVDWNLPQPPNSSVWTYETGSVWRGLKQVRFTNAESMADRSRAFMRLVVVRRNAVVTTSAVDPFGFTRGQSVLPGQTARSSSVTVGGFTGQTTISIPAGVTLFVNGIAKTGSTATVKAGDTLWMQAAAPGTVGVPRNYTLTIGGQSATWSFTTAAIAAVPDHPGNDSGYTPVETGVSDTGVAQISIPIVVAPGTAGMQPKLSIS